VRCARPHRCRFPQLSERRAALLRRGADRGPIFGPAGEGQGAGFWVPKVAIVTAFWITSLTLFLWSRYLTLSDPIVSQSRGAENSVAFNNICERDSVRGGILSNATTSSPKRHHWLAASYFVTLCYLITGLISPTWRCSPCAGSPTTATSPRAAASSCSSRSRWWP